MCLLRAREHTALLLQAEDGWLTKFSVRLERRPARISFPGENRVSCECPHRCDTLGTQVPGTSSHSPACHSNPTDFPSLQDKTPQRHVLGDRQQLTTSSENRTVPGHKG